MNLLKKISGVVVGFFGFIGASVAAVPAGVSAAITSLQTDGLAMADLVWPALLALFGAVLLMKVGKRMLSKI